MILCAPDGTPLLTLGDEAPVDGFLVTGYSEGARTFKRLTTESPFVDGDFELQSSLAGRINTLSIYIEGADWDEATAKHAEVLAIVEVPGWQLAIGGVVWTCRPADSESPMPPKGNASDFREVTLTFPVKQRTGI